ncbi:hypothetical protein [Aquabacterium humicola]|uniref:hypothetical protein n=1 Tax=Aquabacterium humicola TaxID=3237377 RepID=UPI00254292A2|nr:hypothetical protein [Rubrivivax pictus]
MGRWGCLMLCGALLGAAAPAFAQAGGVLFVSNRAGNAQIHLMRADGAGDHALTQGPQENTEPAWSPDGRRIAFTSYRDGNAEIYVMDADGTNQKRLTHSPQADNAPAWTPDGRIVFRSMRERYANFYRMDADGGQLQALTATQLDKGGPVPSPDGRWIAFVGHDVMGAGDIYTMPAGGGEAKNVTAALSKNQKGFPSWSPDGRRLAFVESKGPALNIRSIAPDGSDPQTITDNPFTNASPVWSPDGRQLAFVSSREGSRSELARGDIWVMRADGSGAVNLTRHPDEDNYPAWSADGTAIYFVSLRDGRAQLYAVPAQGGDATRLTRHDGHDVMIRPYVQRPSPASGAAALALGPR